MEAVDFSQAVARALSNNAIVQAAGEEAIAGRNDADVARGYLLPSVRFEEKFVRTSVPAEAFGLKMNQEKLLASDFADVRNFNSPPPRNDFIATLSLEQPLFAPKAYIGYGMAKRRRTRRAGPPGGRRMRCTGSSPRSSTSSRPGNSSRLRAREPPTPGSICGSRRASRRPGWGSPPTSFGRRWLLPQRKAER
jgi:hypothetical protein